MEDKLAGGFADIEEELIAVEVPVSCDVAGHEEHFAHQNLVRLVLLQVLDRLDVFFGHDQDVGLGLGMDILECHHVAVLVEKIGGDFFGDDLAEDTHWARLKR